MGASARSRKRRATPKNRSLRIEGGASPARAPPSRAGPSPSPPRPTNSCADRPPPERAHWRGRAMARQCVGEQGGQGTIGGAHPLKLCGVSPPRQRPRACARARRATREWARPKYWSHKTGFPCRGGGGPARFFFDNAHHATQAQQVEQISSHPQGALLEPNLLAPTNLRYFFFLCLPKSQNIRQSARWSPKKQFLAGRVADNAQKKSRPAPRSRAGGTHDSRVTSHECRQPQEEDGRLTSR